MTTVIEATYDGTVFHPKVPVALEPNTTVRLTVEALPPQQGKGASFLDTAFSLNLQGPPDWSENVDKYLYDEEARRGS